MSGPSHRSRQSGSVVPDTQASSATIQGNGHGNGPPSQSSNGEVQQHLVDQYLGGTIIKLTECNTIGELLRTIPVPAQAVSRDILDGVYQASMKLGGARALLALWKDHLRLQSFDKVSHLNSIRPPTVQVCKEALLGSDSRLSSMNFDEVLKVWKKSALTQSIAIKELEVANLQDYVQARNIGTRLGSAWAGVLRSDAGIVTREHAAFLAHDTTILKVAQVAASIGETSSQRVQLSKQKRVVEKKDSDIDMTDASSDQGKKQLMALVKEAVQRNQQSHRDRALSGKGKGRTGPPKKKKTQKTKERVKKSGASRNVKTKARPGKPRKQR